MTVTLTPELEASLQRRVDTGRYDSASDVVHEALRLLDELDRLRDGQKEEIGRKISAGMDSLRAGRSIDGEEYFDRLDEELSAIDESEASRVVIAFPTKPRRTWRKSSNICCGKAGASSCAMSRLSFGSGFAFSPQLQGLDTGRRI